MNNGGRIGYTKEKASIQNLGPDQSLHSMACRTDLGNEEPLAGQQWPAH